MNLSEAHKLVAILKGVYHREKFTEESPLGYHMLLDDIPYADAMAALMIHGKRSQWCPTPAELRAIIAEQTAPPEISHGAAWEQVQKQINRHGANNGADAVFDHPAVAAAVAAVGWKRLCLEETKYITGEFNRQLEAAQEKARRGVQDGTAALGAGNVTALPERRAS